MNSLRGFLLFIRVNPKYILIFLVALSSIIVQPRVGSWNDASRMATIQSLIETRTLSIDQSVFIKTGDKVFINGHYYSDKPVLPAILGAFIYEPLYRLGLRLDYGFNAAYFLITFFTIKLLWIAGLIAFFQSLKHTELEENYILLLTGTLAFGSLFLTWSATFNNHLVAASFLIIGFYFVLQSRTKNDNIKNLFLAGFFLSLAGLSDNPCIIYYFGFFIFLLTNFEKKSIIIPYLLGGMITIIPNLVINYQMIGNLIPIQIQKAYFEYPGSVWTESGSLSGTNINRGTFLLNYSFTALIGSKGFLIYNPFLFLAFAYLVIEIKSKREFWKEAIVIGGSSLAITGYYLFFTNNYGGWSYSIRWLVPLIPVLYFFIHPIFKDFNLQKRWMYVTLFLISTIIGVIGVINPWSNQILSPIPIWANLKQFYNLFQRAFGDF